MLIALWLKNRRKSLCSDRLEESSRAYPNVKGIGSATTQFG